MHKSVMSQEVIEGLVIKPDGNYIDATFGRGGHAREIRKVLGKAGHLLVIDKDPDAIAHAKALFDQDPQVEIEHGSFAQLQEFVEKHQLSGCIDGILLDLGVSSPQLDEASRGFSFSADGPLDMRMDTTRGMDAATWLHQAEETEIYRVLKEYGEERFSKRIAYAIVQERQIKKIETTAELVRIVIAAQPVKEKHKHPATRVFQAIRIFINDELQELQQCLEQCLEVLRIKGHLVVISFHSLEDRIVKQFMRKHSRGDALPVELPVMHVDLKQRLRCVGKAIKANEKEVSENPRARSAILRIAEKIA